MRLLLVIAFLWMSPVHKVKALTCLTCGSVAQPRHCTEVMTCQDNEVCFVERRVNAVGLDPYALGCMRDQVCRNVTSTSPFSRCSQCCSKDLCNHEGCGEPGYPDPRGPVCYNCIEGVPEGRCHHIGICRPGEFCSISGTSIIGTTVFPSRCMHPGMCRTHHGYGLDIIGKRGGMLGTRTRSYDVHDCFECCAADLCNKNCHNSVDGQWGPWGSWSSCNSHCNQTRSRPCNNPAPEHGGKNCDGNGMQTQNCVTDQCQVVDGQWGQWGSWSSCNSHCNQTRSRLCDNPAPEHGGRNCHGNGTETQNCVTDLCQVRDCFDLHKIDSTLRSGVYTIITPLSHTTIHVYCDMDTDGGGWTVFQKRFNGSVDFYRNFTDYENGFGSVQGEYWLGLQYVQEITSQGTYKLRVDIVNSNGIKGFDEYGNFSLKNGTTYTLNLGARIGSRGVNTSLTFHTADPNGSPVDHAFSTYDKGPATTCGYLYKGGWWFSDCYSHINLNGVYHPGTTSGNDMVYDNSIGLEASTMMFKQ